MSAPRKTLLQVGAKGSPERVRVCVDAKAKRVEVLYKDAQLVPRTKVFADDRQGRRDAVTWAQTYHEQRLRGQGGTPKTTHAELWRAYRESPAWDGLRAKSRQTYAQRWEKWMHLVRGERTLVDDTTLLHIDRFLSDVRKSGRSLYQARMVLATARVVYNWGQSRGLVTRNVLATYRWQTPKDAVVHEPEEYTQEELEKLLAALDPRSGHTWRPWVLVMLAGHHGQRMNALLNLTVDVARDALATGEIVWPAANQKTGVELVQPLTWDAVAAFTTALYWRERTGYAGPWLLFAGGGGKSIGPALVGNARHYRKERAPEDDHPYRYQSAHMALKSAETRAGVEPKPFRAFHAFRRGAAGNVADRTGDARLGLEWIGDRDLKQAKSYLKRRGERLQRAADAVETKTPAPNASRNTVPQVSLTTENEKAPAEAEASIERGATTYSTETAE